ncbi:MAG: M1 family metallopeptidase, partial [Bacteroidia bacterium]|nr:M1 family metallopeptidase [Bacteroidia bacterium]
MKTIAGFGWFIISLQCCAQSYFQQQVNYKIDVKLDDVKHEITAFETIEYINNSPDELNYIYFHLWPNAYKNINTAWAKQMLEDGNTLFYFSKEEDKGYIDQLDFRVNDKPVLLMIDSSNIDIARVILNERLKPGEKITLTTPFHVKIPNGMFSRMGHEGQQYQITQWYPKPAVYDKKGWHPMPYLEQGEFYSEFGTFDVAITVPKNYVVGATGDLQDEEEKKWIDQKANETLARDTFPNTDDFPASDTAIKTLHFKQENVHDFAWFCDKRYNVIRSRVDLPHTHRTVTTWALFTNGQAKLWKKATAYINDALYNYSLWNGDYPYNNCTAVDGALSAGAGMEYPNITVINATSNAFDLDDVITHEVGHNWFYGVLGSNERDHAWMDEGINSYNEYRYIKKKYPNSSVFGERKPKRDFFNINRYSHVYQGYITYLYSAAQNVDEPCDQPAAKY